MVHFQLTLVYLRDFPLFENVSFSLDGLGAVDMEWDGSIEIKERRFLDFGVVSSVFAEEAGTDWALVLCTSFSALLCPDCFSFSVVFGSSSSVLPSSKRSSDVKTFLPTPYNSSHVASLAGVLAVAYLVVFIVIAAFVIAVAYVVAAVVAFLVFACVVAVDIVFFSCCSSS